jgi:hypothetical protein
MSNPQPKLFRQVNVAVEFSFSIANEGVQVDTLRLVSDHLRPALANMASGGRVAVTEPRIRVWERADD